MPTDDELHGQVRTAVQAVLWNASNYPANVQARMLGQDVSPLTAKVTGAILPLIAKAVVAERERLERPCDEEIEAAGRVLYASWDEWDEDDDRANGERHLVKDALSAAADARFAAAIRADREEGLG